MARRRKVGLCLCGSRAPYRACCGRFVDDGELPTSPVELMRSRYSAYAHGDADYLVETTDPDGAAWNDDVEAWKAGNREFARSHRFSGVDILEHQVETGVGVVKFRARLALRRGGDASFVEESHFIKKDGRWLYSWGVVE